MSFFLLYIYIPASSQNSRIYNISFGKRKTFEISKDSIYSYNIRIELNDIKLELNNKQLKLIVIEYCYVIKNNILNIV